jgi:hypothetical protein
MESTPDLSRIVNLIMQNPELIEQISALAKSDQTEEAHTEEEINEDVETVADVSNTPKRDMRSHRHELLSAMKPYLSEGRRSALDSMSSILDIFDVMSHK